MRRTDREVNSVAEIAAILEKCESGTLALTDGDRPYAVPVNFGFERAGDSVTLWFHCAAEGKKLGLIRKNPSACFSADCSHRLIEGDEACEYGYGFESVVASGRISFAGSPEEKRRGLKLIMRQYAPDREFSFPDAAVSRVTVLRLDAGELTGKRANMEIL